MKWLRRILGDDLALQQAIEKQSAAIVALTDRVDERIRAQSTGFENVGAKINEGLISQGVGMEQFGNNVKSSLQSQEKSLIDFSRRLDAGLESVGRQLNASLAMQSTGIAQFAVTMKESLRAQGESLGKYTQQMTDGVERQTEGLAKVSQGIRDIKALPLPVQTYPLVEDPRWEMEKQRAACLAADMFCPLDKQFIEILANAEQDVRSNVEVFIKEIHIASSVRGDARRVAIKKSLECLLACSPKRIIASYQRHALEIGWSYTYTYNRLVDSFAEWYPRCRAGIYSSRLKYSDVIQISDEVLATLRACSTMLEDLQRRYDMLEALQAGLEADYDDPACERIWKALKSALTDSIKNFGNSEDAGLWEKVWKKTGAVLTSPIQGVAGVMAATTAQFNEQMAREQRLMVFLKTALMYCEAWGEWREASKRIVSPNLTILFALKRDYVRNQILCMSDLVNYNNYSLEGVYEKILTIHARPQVIASWRKHSGADGERTCTLQNDGSFYVKGEHAAEWSQGKWSWENDILLLTYTNGQSISHAFHGPDIFSEIHNDKFWYERISA